ncbi:MAG: Zn-dependent hydrolase [Thermoanaerobaculia bacterium]|nr:Zn-dependent hydrolase [Thermoanaerobaculia bacterium]
MTRSLNRRTTLAAIMSVGFTSWFLACTPPAEQGASDSAQQQEAAPSEIDRKLAKYTDFRLSTDVSKLTDAERAMIPLLIEAAEQMDTAFWLQAYGDREQLLSTLTDEKLKRYADINYGPWDRLEDNESFVAGVGDKPSGAAFYPEGVTADEITSAAESKEDLLSLYTMVRSDDSGQLSAVPYSEFFAEQYQIAADKLRQAAELAEDEGLKKYLQLRADALLSDEYLESDLAWMDMKSNGIDVVIGPIEQYEDKLLGRKTANEAYVLVKDKEWSERLSRYAAVLPGLQKGLPVADEYKRETPGTDSDLNAYDVVYYAGDCNAGSKTIAINLPNDERVQLEKGTRRLQLKNAMRAKFDKILVPISRSLIDEDQRGHITFDAFFGNTMFHEVAHGLGIKETITGKGSVRNALGKNASALEEGKADVLGLYMVTQLHGQGEIDGELMDYYTTFLASIFRSIRFGSASAHGVANLIRFNFFQEEGAFRRDGVTGTYEVDPEKMQEAMNALSEKILVLQGDGDSAAVEAFVAQYGQEGDQLRADLDRLEADEGIPVDITFTQGVDVLGL